MNSDTEIDSIPKLDEETQQKIKEQAEKKANKILRKNRHEVRRLKDLYGKSLIEGNKEQFMYVLEKLRRLCKQPVSNDILEYCWKTSSEAISEVVNDHQSKIQES